MGTLDDEEMELVYRVRRKIARDGFVTTLAQRLLRLESIYFDWKHGVDTHGIIRLENLEINSASVAVGRQYQPILVRHWNEILRSLKVCDSDVLVDFGCGKGRVLLLGAMSGFKNVIGVEFSPDLCSIARDNASKFRGIGGCRIQVFEGDAGAYEISEEQTIFFFFNPFDNPILGKVVDNIRASVEECPRAASIVFLNMSPDRQLGDIFPFKLATSKQLTGLPLHIYSTA
jgi:SAM-dependent methyltransferase